MAFERLRSLVTGRVPNARTIDPPFEEWAPPPEGEERLGVCCSGGGIRSASYNLGALQALQKYEVLQKATHLACVSGGGYIAGALTMIAHSDQALVEGTNAAPFARLSPEEGYLRNHSSYLAPDARGKLKLFSSVILGFFVNAAFLGSLVVLAGRGLGYLASMTEPSLTQGSGVTDPISWREPAWQLAVVMSGGVFVLAGLSLILLTVLNRLSWKRECYFNSWGRGLIKLGAGLIIIFGLFPALIADVRSSLVAEVPVIGEPVGEIFVDVDHGARGSLEEGDQVRESRTTGSAALSRLFGWIAALGVPAMVAGVLRSLFKKKAIKLATAAGSVVAPLLIFSGLLAAASDAASSGTRGLVGSPPDDLLWIAVPVGLIAALFLLSDLTATSLHPFYKRRLSTAFALERVPCSPPREGCQSVRERDYDKHIPLSEMGSIEGRWPNLVCCAAANINDYGMTAPGRRSVTFTFEAERVGGPEVGYIPMSQYQQVLGTKRREDITLPAAMAISGAALSPSMGKMSKPSLTFLLALFNARLGVWLPHPRLALQLSRRAADQAKEKGSASGEPASIKGWERPKPRFSWLLREMRGRNSGVARFLYVTDGGHWENLGLVELLRRGCTVIYCIDAAGDKEKTFFTIGEAMALARSELGVEMSLRPDAIRPLPGSSYSATDHVIGTFTYPNGRTGKIVFCKAAVTQAAPWDIRAYKEGDPAFPNHGLIAQMFPDKTFESYRKLGEFTMTRALQAMGYSVD